MRGRAEKTVVQVPVFFEFKGTAVGQNFHLHAEGVNRKGHVDHAVFKVEGFAPFALFGIFRFDLVAFLFGDMSWLSRIIYTLVGLSGLYLISTYGRICQVDDAR